MGNVEAVNCLTVGVVAMKVSRLVNCYIYRYKGLKNATYRLLSIHESIDSCHIQEFVWLNGSVDFE